MRRSMASRRVQTFAVFVCFLQIVRGRPRFLGVLGEKEGGIPMTLVHRSTVTSVESKGRTRRDRASLYSTLLSCCTNQHHRRDTVGSVLWRRMLLARAVKSVWLQKEGFLQPWWPPELMDSTTLAEIRSVDSTHRPFSLFTYFLFAYLL